MSRRKLLLTAWLVFECGFNMFMGCWFIPHFFKSVPFVQTTILGVSNDGELSSACNVTIDKEKSVESLLHIHKQVYSNKACWNVTDVTLWEEVLNELRLKDYKESLERRKEEYDPMEAMMHIFNGVVLGICGFVAPFGEMLIRVINNLSYLCNLGRHAPKLNENFHFVYEVSHGPLQHLTQFKLYLCFLQSLLSINVLGLNIMQSKGLEGMHDFVRFVAWSMFINSVVKRLEKPLKEDEPFFPNILPHADWVPKILDSFSGGYSRTRTFLSGIKLVGLYLIYALPVFTLVFQFTPAKTEKGMCDSFGVDSIKYYTFSFLPIGSGLVKLRESGDWLLLCLLFFKFFICNLALPVFQLTHGIAQEFIHHQFPKYGRVGWTEAPLKASSQLPLLTDMAPRSIGHTLTRRHTKTASESTQYWSEASWEKKIVALILQSCAENQSHEYLVCAFLMLVTILITVLHTFGLDATKVDDESLLQALNVTNQKPHECGTMSVLLCYSPLACFALFSGVALFGRARAMLYAMDEHAGSAVHLYARMRKVNSNVKYFGLVVFWMFIVLFMAYTLVINNIQARAIRNYFGGFTFTKDYVTDPDTSQPFNCLTYLDVDGEEFEHCVSSPGGLPNVTVIDRYASLLLTLASKVADGAAVTGG